MTYQCEKLMTENADKLTDADKEPMNKAIEKVKSAAAGSDINSIKQATEELNAASQAFSKVLYEKSSSTGEAGSSPKSGSGADDDAIDAEFEVKE
jgi:molecular chaperone DnaK